MKGEMKMENLEKYFEYLEQLRRSGITNMFGATIYLEQDFDLTHDEAKRILLAWMRTYSFTE